ncbi:MAG: dephospho-CoA kinase [Actinomycetota bacterium]
MLLVGLTGGIGAGKSTVARLLEEHGAVVIDADELARQAIAPGTEGFARVIRSFGKEILAPDGSIDRQLLANIVFANAERRGKLEAIVLPEVARGLAEAIERYRDTDRIVVYDVPLLVERDMADAFDVVVVVVAEMELRVHRLCRERGMTPEDVRARIAAQMTDEERARVADVILDNNGAPQALALQVERLWEQLTERSAAGR